MTIPIQSAKTAKEMLEAVCEDLERVAQFWEEERADIRRLRRWRNVALLKMQTLQNRVNEYRAILKGME